MPKKPTPVAPEVEPKPSKGDRDKTSKSDVGEVQHPNISGDAKTTEQKESGEAVVDEAGQIRKPQFPVDLLH